MTMTFKNQRIAKTLAFTLLAGLAGSLSACNTPTKAVESVNEPAQETAAESEANSNIIQQSSSVTQKGTIIKAIVNGEPITNYDVQRRAAFLKLRRAPGGNAKALEEMVDERIKIQEAKRLGTAAGDAQVDEAFANFSKSNKLSAPQMATILGSAGVGADHFKEYIRAQISWNGAVGQQVRTGRKGKSTQEQMFEIRQSGGQKPETTEYILQQTIFVIPAAKKKALLGKRTQEANAFRGQFTNCDATPKQAIGQLDVTVRDLGRTLEPQLPPLWLEEVKKTPEGGTTAVKETEKGVEFLAVCSRKLTDDDNAVSIINQAKEFEDLNKNGDDVSEKFLAEVKAKSKIIYR